MRWPRVTNKKQTKKRTVIDRADKKVMGHLSSPLKHNKMDILHSASVYDRCLTWVYIPARCSRTSSQSLMTKWSLSAAFHVNRGSQNHTSRFRIAWKQNLVRSHSVDHQVATDWDKFQNLFHYYMLVVSCLITWIFFKTPMFGVCKFLNVFATSWCVSTHAACWQSLCWLVIFWYFSILLKSVSTRKTMTNFSNLLAVLSFLLLLLTIPPPKKKKKTTTKKKTKKL